MPSALAFLRQRIHDEYRRDESACVADLIADYERRPPDRGQIRTEARKLVVAVRAQREHASGVDHLMHEFSLSSEEGVALMCVAEALLRIPDPETADRLIRDKLAKGEWKSHLGAGGSLFVSAATWGLLITGKLVATRSDESLGNALVRLVARCGEPVIRKSTALAMQLLGRQFVMGENIGAALERSAGNEERGYTHSFDRLGEAALTAEDAARYFLAYQEAIDAIGVSAQGRGVLAGPGISVKLSALHPRYTRLKKERVIDELFPRLLSLAEQASHYDIGFNIDAEEADRLELSLDLVEMLLARPELDGWEGLGFVVQAYQKRAPAVIDHLLALARHRQRKLMIRLVKGAYWDSEIKRAQVEGLADYPVFTRKCHADLCYLVCAAKMLDASDVVYPQFATHNALTLASVREMAAERGVSRYEFQCLHGMGEPLYNNLVGASTAGVQCRIYAPVGSYETLLPYLVRRLLENGSNSSFVNQIVDEAISVDALLADPHALARAAGGARHPKIPVPPALFGAERANSCGLDLADERALETLERLLDELKTASWEALPLVVGESHRGRARQPVLNPANHLDCVGFVAEADADLVARALDAAVAFAPDWQALGAPKRAARLQALAGLLEKNRVALISLCLREAGKTRANAIAEVREAIDFCHYYASQALSCQAAGAEPGPMICISPWNFPLAIFVGQVAAALVSGHPVIAKPAGQTPLIAAFAVRLFHEAGFPLASLQLLPGKGGTVGAALVGDPRLAGVIFTGSLPVAQAINRRIATHPRDVRFIAETGGINAMIVDSSAHLEQLVHDVLVSAFDSAGQRCSALRVLCVQEEIADRLLPMLEKAMLELKVGDPARLDVDIGPVIDAAAQARLQAHINAFMFRQKLYFKVPTPEGCEHGTFIAPTLLEIETPAELPEEVFGPILHVLRFKRQALGPLIDSINASGFGLTFGVHSRIEETIEFAARRIQAGNIYVNRNMVGAVVGVQPFGGDGKSGTGPKAGGPLYLPRLIDSASFPMATGPASAAVPESLAQFSDWAFRTGRNALSKLCCDYRASGVFEYQQRLPGPTGETNHLRLIPRGLLWCRADNEQKLYPQLAAVFATGNTPLVANNDIVNAAILQLPSVLRLKVVVFENPVEHHNLAGVLASDPADGLRLKPLLAARDGEILPVISPDSGGSYPLYRLMKERVVSVNTASAGGDTRLMMLGDEGSAVAG